MLIRNFGHLWERKYLNYGRPKVRGHLKGYLSPRSGEVDFREQMGIYVLFDKDLSPVYIGQAGKNQKLFGRLKQHDTDHLWNRWEHFSWFGFRRVNKNGDLSLFDDLHKTFKISGTLLLNEIEGALITALEPKLNKQGARWKDVDEYFQFVDDEKEDVTLGHVLDSNARLEKLITGLGKKILKAK
jgi:hypothetical protein